MDRIINIKVSGHHLSKDNNNAGARGEGNVTILRITFDANWYTFTKTMTFWDALGANPVKRVITTDLLDSVVGEVETYLVPIPPEPMMIAGKLMFVIDGYTDDKRQRSVADELVVEDSPIIASEPIPPTPTEIEQLQKQINTNINNIYQAAQAMNEAIQAKNQANTSATEAKVAAKVAENFATEAEQNKNMGVEYANLAAEHASSALDAISKAPHIGYNGNWFVWSALENRYIDTEVKAQSGSTVYIGDNPPADADVWIYPDGVAVGATTKSFINLLGGTDNWDVENVEDSHGNVVGVRYGQKVNVNNATITPYSKVDMQISSEQMVIFYEKDLAFVAENDNGVVTVYCIGSIPQNDYTIQVTVTEVVLDEA